MSSSHAPDHLHILPRPHFFREILQNELSGIAAHFIATVRVVFQVADSRDEFGAVLGVGKEAAVVLFKDVFQFSFIEAGDDRAAAGRRAGAGTDG